MQKWFPHKRGFASGLGASAFGLSTVVFSPVISALLGSMSLSRTLMVLSILFLVVGVVACLFISLPDQSYLAGLHLPAAASPAAGADNSKNLWPKPPAPCPSGCCFWAASCSTAPGICSPPSSTV